MLDLPDEQLMQSYINGNTKAFELLYQKHKEPLHRYLIRQCQTRAIAEELFQDTWIKVINAKQRYQSSAKFSTYLYHIAHHILIDHYRTHSKNVLNSYQSHDDEILDKLAVPSNQQPDQQLIQDQKINQLIRIVTDLPEAQREAFILKEEAGLSLDEIAEVTGSNKQAVKSRLRYAFNKTRTELGGIE
ncbi:MAG: sigma-70 family RNA polymerase sigma factor [Methylococcales bacterium]|nr:sigma-70 family RNA polymerase sigma factor [Methylococcales bacterium]MBT7408814.1 sigma-70 family RNA polymerase sigma factor [Methylococcales bacterium]